MPLLAAGERFVRTARNAGTIGTNPFDATAVGAGSTPFGCARRPPRRSTFRHCSNACPPARHRRLRCKAARLIVDIGAPAIDNHMRAHLSHQFYPVVCTEN
jgi:hypothetical protein